MAALELLSPLTPSGAYVTVHRARVGGAAIVADGAAAANANATTNADAAAAAAADEAAALLLPPAAFALSSSARRRTLRLRWAASAVDAFAPREQPASVVAPSSSTHPPLLWAKGRLKSSRPPPPPPPTTRHSSTQSSVLCCCTRPVNLGDGLPMTCRLSNARPAALRCHSGLLLDRSFRKREAWRLPLLSSSLLSPRAPRRPRPPSVNPPARQHQVLAGCAEEARAERMDSYGPLR
jgi:hypothetical protein